MKSVDLSRAASPAPTAGRLLNPLIGGLVWLAGLALTARFVAELQPTMPLWMALLVALVTQILLSVLEHDIWRRRYAALPAVALVIDVLLNAAGLYYAVRALEQTTLVRMLVEVFRLRSDDVSAPVAFGVACMIGLIIAATPEYLWRRQS